jgi:hypothetical protein
MSKTQYEISVITGKYTNKDGQEKNRYMRIGSVIDTKNGPMIKFDCFPVVDGGWSGWAYMNKPKDQASKDDFGDVEF